MDLIKKECSFVNSINNSQQQTPSISKAAANDLNTIIKDKKCTIQQQRQAANNDPIIAKDKVVRKHIANTPVIMENPANRFQIINNSNNRAHYYSSENQSNNNNNLLSTSSVINNNPSPINNETILHNQEQDLLNNNNSQINDKQQQQIIHDNTWLDDPDNVLHLKEQLQQQFRTPPNKLNQQQQPTNLVNNLNNNLNNNIKLHPHSTIPAHVFSAGEKSRRYSDSATEIRNNQNNANVNHHQNYNNYSSHVQQQQQNGLMNQTINNTQLNQNSVQHQQMQHSTNNLHSQSILSSSSQIGGGYDTINDTISSQIENSNNNFDYNLKRKQQQHNRTEPETSANETTATTTMDHLPESQLILNSTQNTNYLTTSNHLPTSTATSAHHQLFYNNNNNLAYQSSHSVPTTPTTTILNQNFFNQRIDLNNVVNQQQLSHDYQDQLSNQISHHHSHLNQQQQQQQHSLPCTPKQPTSFTFSPHQVQHYQQQNQTYLNQNSSQNNHFNSSPNTPITPCTPITPTAASSNHQYQDNLIVQSSRATLHQPQHQSNNSNNNNSSNSNLNAINSSIHKNLNNLYSNVEFNNNTICSRGKLINQQQQQQQPTNYGMIANSNNHHSQFLANLDSNDNLAENADHHHLNNNAVAYSTILNDDYMVDETTGYSHNEQFTPTNCQLTNELDTQQRNLNSYQLNNNNNVICSNTSYTQNAQLSNVIMSNYAGSNDEQQQQFCETRNQLNASNLISEELNNSKNNNSLRDNLNSNSTTMTNTNTQSINCTNASNSNAAIIPAEKSYTRVTLRSVSPNLVIETDSYKNSTADDSQNYSNLNEDEDDDVFSNDDVFLRPTEINQAPISSPKTNCINSKKTTKSYINSANGTFLAGNSTTHNNSSSIVNNLPQVDFTHPQQATAINLNNNKEEHHLNHINDINFNQIKLSSHTSSLGKQEKLNELSSNHHSKHNLNHSSNQLDSNNFKQISRTNTASSSPKRIKHRPEPLHIPPHVNARIHKSSRIWPLNDSHSSKFDLNCKPPYTPPPMLSPIRTSNSSYYWYILTGNLTPRTITNFFGSRKNLEQQQQQSNANKSHHSFDFFNNNETIANNFNIATPSTAYEPLDSCLADEENAFDFSSYSTNAHVNVGKQYQARIPTFNPNKEDAKLHYRNERADKVWSPSVLDKITNSSNQDSNNNARQCKVIAHSKRKTNLVKELELYLELSCSACVNGNGRNKEYAYHILFQNNGDLNKSIK